MAAGADEPAMSGTFDLAAWIHSVFGHTPTHLQLFEQALTHRSAAGVNNERLEFLGDAVLNLTAAELLYHRFADADEGALSRLRARLVNGEALADIAARLNIGERLVLGPGELKTGGFRRQSILADALEALCGALFLDAGLAAARSGLLPLLEDTLARTDAPGELKDPKTRLQERLQARGLPLPQYRVDGVEGELHAQVFRVTCEVSALGASAKGEGSSRRRAEQIAAAAVLAQIDQD
jgi:ribonuclease-3